MHVWINVVKNQTHKKRGTVSIHRNPIEKWGDDINLNITMEVPRKPQKAQADHWKQPWDKCLTTSLFFNRKSIKEPTETGTDVSIFTFFFFFFFLLNYKF